MYVNTRVLSQASARIDRSAIAVFTAGGASLLLSLGVVGAVGLVHIVGWVVGVVVTRRASISRMDCRCCSTRCLSAAPSFFCSVVPSASTASSTLFRTLASLVA